MHQIESGKLAASPALNLFMEEKNTDLRGICLIFLEHLTTFVSELNRYIPSQNYLIGYQYKVLSSVSTRGLFTNGLLC